LDLARRALAESRRMFVEWKVSKLDIAAVRGLLESQQDSALVDRRTKCNPASMRIAAIADTQFRLITDSASA
jgi:hypothetical protein